MRCKLSGLTHLTGVRLADEIAPWRSFSAVFTPAGSWIAIKARITAMEFAGPGVAPAASISTPFVPHAWGTLISGTPPRPLAGGILHFFFGVGGSSSARCFATLQHDNPCICHSGVPGTFNPIGDEESGAGNSSGDRRRDSSEMTRHGHFILNWNSILFKTSLRAAKHCPPGTERAHWPSTVGTRSL